MKVKILSLLLSVTLFFSAVIPSRAAESDNPFIDLLDYGFCLENDTNTQNFNGSSSLVFTYDVPDRLTIQYIDVLFTYYVNDTVDVSLYNGNSKRGDLTVVKVFGNVFRAYGSVSAYYADNVGLHFDIDSTSSNRITIESVRVGRTSYSHMDIEAYCDIKSADYSETIHYVPTDDVNHRIFMGPSEVTSTDVGLYIWSNSWKNFDYIDVLLFVEFSGISSFTAIYDGSQVPISYSYTQSTYYGYPGWLVSIRMDLRGLDRTLDDEPMIFLQGALNINEMNSVAMMSCVGIIDIQAADPDLVWYVKLWNSINIVANNIYILTQDISDWFFTLIDDLDTFFSTQTETIILEITHFFGDLNRTIDDQTLALKEYIQEAAHLISSALNDLKRDSTTKDDSFSSEATERQDELDQMVGIMDSVDRPDINTLDPALQLSNSGADIPGGIGPVLTVTMRNPIILQVLMLSLTFAMIAYVLYGKR